MDRGLCMATFTVSLSAIIPVSASAQIASDNAADAQAQALAMQSRGQLVWTYKFTSVGAYTGPVSSCWALGTSPFNVSLTASVPISTVVTVQAQDAASAVAQANILQSQSRLQWTHNGTVIGSYQGPISESWSTLVVTPPLVIPIRTTTTLSVSSQSVVIQSPISLTAVVNPGVTGPVQFFAGLTFLGVATPDSLGIATIASVSLNVGVNNVVAKFQGDATYAPSESKIVVVTVSPVTTNLMLNVSPSIAPLSALVTMTATVSAPIGTPMGAVGFYDQTRLLGSIPLVDGTAVFTISSLPLGTYTITARYAGITEFGSSSASASLDIAIPTTLIPFSSLPESVYGESVTFYAIVFAPIPYGIPTGSVSAQATSGSQTVMFGPFVLDEGFASFATSLPAGTWDFVFNFIPATPAYVPTSSPFTQLVDQDTCELFYDIFPTSSGGFPTVTLNMSIVPEIAGVIGTGVFEFVYENTTTFECSSYLIQAINNQGQLLFTPTGAPGQSYIGTVQYLADPNIAEQTSNAFGFGPYG